MKLTLDMIAKDAAEKALDEITYEGKTIREWVEIIAKQQPCEDCISRQAVLDKKELVELEDGQSFYCINPEDVETLLPVTPQPCEDCVSREEAIRIAEQGQIQGYEWQFKKLCTLPSVTPSYNSIKTELKPCEDCVSREAIKEKKVYSEERHEYVVPVAEIDWLPSVKPQRPKGKWVVDRCVRRNDDYHYTVHCDKCGKIWDYTTDKKDSIPSDYCPNCGAEMEDSNGE